MRAVPVGFSWLYDIQRFSKTRGLTTFIDGGANIGQTARQFLLHFPRASIHAFEPVRSTFQQLRRGVSRHTNVRCVHQALGATRRRTSIELREDSQLNTLAPAASRPAAVGCEDIDVDTLDNYCRQQSISDIDVLKLDVQGYELEVLAGAQNLLRERRVKFVYSEITFDGPGREMQDFVPLHRFLLANGFALSGFYEPLRWGQGKHRLGFYNALYTHLDVATQ